MSQDRTKNICEQCHFWQIGKSGHVGDCHRFPTSVVTFPYYWCGEFAASYEAVMQLKDAIDKEILKREVMQQTEPEPSISVAPFKFVFCPKCKTAFSASMHPPPKCPACQGPVQLVEPA